MFDVYIMKIIFLVQLLCYLNILPPNVTPSDFSLQNRLNSFIKVECCSIVIVNIHTEELFVAERIDSLYCNRILLLQRSECQILILYDLVAEMHYVGNVRAIKNYLCCLY